MPESADLVELFICSFHTLCYGVVGSLEKSLAGKEMGQAPRRAALLLLIDCFLEGTSDVVIAQEDLLEKCVELQLYTAEAGVSGPLGDLQANGYIRLKTDPMDRRRHTVALTARGKRFVSQAKKRLRQAVSSKMNKLSESEQKTMAELMTKLIG